MKNWLMFLALGAIWGSSFLLIKIGVQELDAFSLVTGRLGVAALAFVGLLAVLRKRIPLDGRTLFGIVLVGILNAALPFVLITWGETLIPSGLAGVLNGTTPLFGLVLAHLFIADDKINPYKLAGLIVGFIGIVILALRPDVSATPDAHNNSLVGQLAVLIAAASYAVAAVYTRRFMRHVEPVVMAGSSMVVGAVVVLLLTGFVVRPQVAVLSPHTVVAVIVLGLLNSFVASNLYFLLLRDWGASRTTMVTYLPPAISLILGAIFASEILDGQLLVGAGLIALGVAVANLRQFQALLVRPKKAVPAESATAD